MFERPSFLIQSPGSYKSARTLRPHLQDHNKCSCSRLHDGRLKLRFVKNFYLKVINWMFESNIWILGWDGIVTKPFGHPKCLERLLVSASCRARGSRNSSKWLLRHKERYVIKYTCHNLSRNLISMTLVAPWNERKGVRGRDLSPPSLPPSPPPPSSCPMQSREWAIDCGSIDHFRVCVQFPLKGGSMWN